MDALGDDDGGNNNSTLGEHHGAGSFLMHLDCEESDVGDSSNQTTTVSELTSMDDDVPYLLDSDSILNLAASPPGGGHHNLSSHHQQDDEYQSAAISLHSYSQALPSISGVGLHNYSQPVNRIHPSSMDVLHNYSQPWPQNTSSSTSVHNYCINNVDERREGNGETQEHIFKVTRTESNEPLCLKIKFTDSYICHWKNCGSAFRSVELLAKHATKHLVQPERPGAWVCLWLNCSRKLKPMIARHKLVQHIRVHTCERPHKCGICLDEFSSAEGLTKHQRIHTGDKPYQCTYPDCNKAFKNTGDRTKHVKGHKTKWPYHCKEPGCEKKYTDPGSLRKHCRAHGHASCSKQQEETNPPSSHLHTIHTATLVPDSDGDGDADTPQLAGLIVSSTVPPGSIVRTYASTTTTETNQGMAVSTSNPLLSSALMLSTTADRLYTVDVKDGSVQEAPLDLSTNIPEDCVMSSNGHTYTKWIDLDT